MAIGSACTGVVVLMMHEGVVTRKDGDNVFVFVSDLGSVFDELRSAVAASQLSVGDKVLVATKGVIPENLAIIGRVGGMVTSGADDDSAYMQKASNLSDLSNASTARTNLGLGSAAVAATGDFDAAGAAATAISTAASDATTKAGTAQSNAIAASAQRASNLSDLASAATARTNLGLGSAATVASSSFDAAGAASTAQSNAIAASAQRTSNLSDLASASTARTNLGLGGAALLNVGTTTGTVAAGDDSRLTQSGTAYWTGTSGSGTWEARPTMGSGQQVTWRSVLDPLAPPPTYAVAGDTWLRAPGSSF
jgi:hypothetical protein